VPRAEYDKLKKDLAFTGDEAAAAKADAVRARSEAEAAKRGEVAARNEAEAAREGAAHARNEAEVAKDGEKRAKDEASLAIKAAAAAREKVADLIKRLDDFEGDGFKTRQRRIVDCRYGLFVMLNKDDTKMYYSPLVEIGTNRYVIAYFPRKDINSISQMSVLSTDCKRISEIESVCGLKGGYDPDIIFFRLSTPSERHALSVGNVEQYERDYFYWFRAGGCKVAEADILSADIKTALDDYLKIRPGDMRISERNESVIGMATAKVSELKHETIFEKRITEEDLVLLRDCVRGK
jgi:hypothetical protein